MRLFEQKFREYLKEDLADSDIKRKILGLELKGYINKLNNESTLSSEEKDLVRRYIEDITSNYETYISDEDLDYYKNDSIKDNPSRAYDRIAGKFELAGDEIFDYEPPTTKNRKDLENETSEFLKALGYEGSELDFPYESDKKSNHGIHDLAGDTNSGIINSIDDFISVDGNIDKLKKALLTKIDSLPEPSNKSYYIYVWKLVSIEDDFDEDDEYRFPNYLYDIVRYALSNKSSEVVGKANIEIPVEPYGGSSAVSKSDLYPKQWSNLTDNINLTGNTPPDIPMVVLSNSDGDILDSSDIFEKN